MDANDPDGCAAAPTVAPPPSRVFIGFLVTTFCATSCWYVLLASFTLSGADKEAETAEGAAAGDAAGAGATVTPEIPWLDHALLQWHVFGLACLLTVVAIALERYHRYRGRSFHRRIDLNVPVPSETRELSGKGKKAVTRSPFIEFARLIRKPGDYIHRITENVERETRTNVVKTTYQARFWSEGAGEGLLFPVLWIPRSEMYPGLEVFDSKGTVVATVTARETLDYIQRALRKYIRKALTKPSMHIYRSTVEPKLLELLDIVGEKKARSLADEIKKTVESLPVRQKLSHDQVHSIVAGYGVIVDEFINRYPTCVRLDERTATPKTELVGKNGKKRRKYYDVVISVRYTELSVERTVRRSLWELFRSPPNILETSPSVYHSMGNADRTDSYHLHIKGPPRTYLAMVAIEKPEGVLDQGPRPKARKITMADRRGQRHLQLFSRRGAGFKDGYELEATFLETSPGSTALAALAAAIAYVTIFSAFLLQMYVDIRGNLDLLLPVLLLIPVTLGGWVGFSPDSRDSGHKTRESVRSGQVTVYVSVAAALILGIFGAGALGRLVGRVSWISDQVGFLGQVSIGLWGLALSIELTNLLATVSAWRLRSWVEQGFISGMAHEVRCRPT
ncbi:MAG: hypothetical protein FWD11_04000 [Micrococcales bacterium]|nr:hypothetical protein [Micrococcales bacterium]